MKGTGETIATLHCGDSTPLNGGPSEVVFSEGRMQGELCFLPAANHARRHQEEFPTQHWAPQPTSQMLSGVCQGEAQLQLQQQVPLPGSPWQPGVCQVSSSALEKWPPSRMRVAWSMEGAVSPLSPPRWER